MYIWQSVLNTQFMHYTKQIQRHKLTSLLSFSVVNKTVHNKGGSARLCVETGAEVERNVDHNLSRTSARVPGPSGRLCNQRDYDANEKSCRSNGLDRLG